MLWNSKTFKLAQSNVNTWVNTFSQLFQEFLKEKTHPFRLIEIKYCNKSEKLLSKLQYSAKNAFFELNLQELIISDKIIEGLSPFDVRVATYYACIETLCPQLYIDSLLYSDKHQEEVFNIVNHHTKSATFKTAAEISHHKSLIKKFSPEDAHKIGFIHGTNTILSERREISNINNMDKIDEQ